MTSLFLLKEKYIEEFKSSSTFLSANKHLFKSVETDNGKAYLLDTKMDLNSLEIQSDDFLEVSLSNVVDIQGEWTDVANNNDFGIKGSMTFVLSNISDSDHFEDLLKFYELGLIKENTDKISKLMERGVSFLEDFMEEYDGYEGEDEEIDKYWAILDELAPLYDEDYDTLIDEIKYQYIFKELGLSCEADIDEGYIICSLDGTVDFVKYLEYREILMDEMSELENGEFDFGYSLWEGSDNIDLFEELGIDNGDYISYPAMYYDKYQSEPETGNWYTL